jgi:hypothetical protein
MVIANSFRKASAKKRAFLAAFSSTWSLSLAAKGAGIDRRTHYNWLKSDPSYAKAFELTKLMAADALEEEATHRALRGTKREVLYKGKPVIVDGEPYSEIKYSDRMLIFLLKSLRPEKYREHSQELADWDGDMTKLTEAQLDKVKAQARALIEEERRNAAVDDAATIDVQLEKPTK